jgi:hypothetical protein
MILWKKKKKKKEGVNEQKKGDFLPQFEHACHISGGNPQVKKKKKKGSPNNKERSADFFLNEKHTVSLGRNVC